jgi:hypothetical protein
MDEVTGAPLLIVTSEVRFPWAPLNCPIEVKSRTGNVVRTLCADLEGDGGTMLTRLSNDTERSKAPKERRLSGGRQP